MVLVAIDENVVRVNIAMAYAVFVELIDTFRDIDGDGKNFSRCKFALLLIKHVSSDAIETWRISKVFPIRRV